jgi:hypothetical protein
MLSSTSGKTSALSANSSSSRHVLPADLPNAITHLDDQEFDTSIPDPLPHKGNVVSAKKAQIFILKEAAAQRQLDAAIRMTLLGEDELAIHTVAAAAYEVLRDLKKKHSRRELSDRLGTGIFAIASDLASGKIDKLPPAIAEAKILVPIITEICTAIRRGDVKDENDVIGRLAIINEQSYWRKFKESANFLKHADIDPGASLSVDKVDNRLLLMLAISAYVELMGTPTLEMFVCAVFLGCDLEVFSSKLRAISKLPIGKRRRACLSLLRKCKTRGAAALA